MVCFIYCCCVAILNESAKTRHMKRSTKPSRSTNIKLTVAGEFQISLYYMKRNWKLIYYSILSSWPIISKKITNKPFQKGSHINNTFLKGGYYCFKCQGKESLSHRIYHTVSHLSDIRLNFDLYLTSYVSFYLVGGSLIARELFNYILIRL